MVDIDLIHIRNIVVCTFVMPWPFNATKLCKREHFLIVAKLLSARNEEKIGTELNQRYIRILAM